MEMFRYKHDEEKNIIHSTVEVVDGNVSCLCCDSRPINVVFFILSYNNVFPKLWASRSIVPQNPVAVYILQYKFMKIYVNRA